MTLLSIITLKPETLPAQCLPPTPAIANGSFESGDYPCTTPLAAFATGCIDDWFAATESPAIFEEFSNNESSTVTPQQGDYFALCAAYNDPIAEECHHEAIVQEIDLIPGYSYRLQFYASTISPSPYNNPLQLNIYYTSGLSNAPTTTDVGECLSLSSGDLVYSESFQSYGSWTLIDITFQVPISSTADQLVVFPVSLINSLSYYYLLLDNFSISLCTYSDLEADFHASLQGGLMYDFEDVTAETGGVTVEGWCWDFGDGNYSSLQNPSHTYEEAGTYEVCLTIIDSKGCMNESCMTIVAEQACDCDDASFLYVSGEQTWDETTVLSNHLIIPAGSRLIIDAAEVYIAKGCKIFVERGARLDIINKSTLNSGCETGRWGGIEVWGNGALAHPSGTSGITGGTYPGSNSEHGVVYLNNGSAVANADIAISTESRGPYWQPYGGGANWGLHWGGIVYAEGNDGDGPVTFFRNGKGVEIQKFPHPSIANPTNPYPNSSHFYKCLFDENTVGMSIWDSDDIGINTSTFDESGQACITGIDFSATIKKCTLSNSLIGIEANYTPGVMIPFDLLIGDPDVSANGNTLDELSFGVVARSSTNLVISNNDFSTGVAGAYLLGASGYNIKANNFTDYRYGVVANQTMNTYNGSLECNTYSSMSYDGVLAWGNNDYLKFKQETFDLEYNRDMRLLQQTDGTFGSINGAQGQTDNPVLNLFSGDDHIIADRFSTQNFVYYVPGSDITTTYPDLIPRCDLNLTNCIGGTKNNFYDYFSNNLGDYDDGCLDLPGVGGLAPDNSCKSLGCLDTLNTEIVTRRALIDDDDTEGLLYAIANDANGTQTFNDLRTASPYLSHEVLEAMLESGMTTGKKDSLSKINAPLAFTLMALAEAELSSPAYAQIEYLRETLGVSAMELLQSELSDLEHRRTGAIDAMVRDHLEKDEIGAADTLLMNEGEVKKRIGLKLYTGDLTTAQTLLNTLPADDYRTVQQINIDRLDEGNDYELETSDAEDLEEIAAKVSPEAAYAQVLLILLRGDTFALQLPEEEESLLRPHLPGAQPVLTSTALKVQPNPTRGQVEVILPEAMAAAEPREGRLALYDVKGQLVRSTTFTGPSTTLQIGELPAGVYLIRYTNGVTVLAAKVIIQH